MKKGSLISLFILLIVSISADARSNVTRFTFGSECSYAGVFYSGYHYNFFAPEGYRVDPREYGLTYKTNAEALIHGGMDFGEKWNLSMYTGLSAFEDQHLTVPVSIRISRYYKGNIVGDQWFSFIDLGSGFSLKARPQEIYTGKLGGGYRLSLSSRTKLDIVMALRTVYTHTDIYYDGIRIPYDKINRNNAYDSAITLGIGLTF